MYNNLSLLSYERFNSAPYIRKSASYWLATLLLNKVLEGPNHFDKARTGNEMYGD